MNNEDWDNQSSGTAGAAEALLDYAERQVARAEKASRGLPPSLGSAASFPGYALVRRIQAGGQGVVYEAVQDATRRSVAIKVTRETVGDDPANRARFAREVEVLSQLQHPNIVRLTDGGEVGDRYYFVTDYIGGAPLHTYLSDNDVPIRAMVALFATICEAVNAAHLRGVVHRDLKPSNILIDQRGQPHILDFGLAKLMELGGGPVSDRRDITVTGQFVGSLPWATPEQVQGDSRGIDVRTDVYALGVTMYHALTGRFPYDVDGPAPEVLNNILHAEPRLPEAGGRRIPDDLQTIVIKSLNKQPDRRYQNAGELAHDLRRYLAGEPIEAKRDSTWYVLAKAARRHRVIVAFSALLLVATFIYAGTITVLFQRVTAAETRTQQYAANTHDKLSLAIDALAFMVGEVSEGLRETSGAGEARRKILEGAYSHLQSLAEGDADAPELQREIARARYELGDVALALGRMSEAEQHLNEALSIRQSLADVAPNDHELLSEISINLVRIGDSLKERHDVVRVRDLYEQALRIDETLVGQQPDNVHYLDNLLWSYERMSWAARYAGELAEAVVFSDKQCELAARLLERDPDAPRRLFGQFAAHDQRFRLSVELGDAHAAIGHAGKAIEYGDRLLSVEPGNPGYSYRIASVHIDLADLQRQRGQIQAARENVLEGLSMAEPLAQANPGEIVYQRVLWAGVWVAAQIGESDPEGDRSITREYFRRAADVAQRMVDMAPENPEYWQICVTSMHRLGNIEHELGNDERGRRHIQYAVEVAEEAIGTPLESSDLLCTYAMLLRESPYPEFRDLERALEVAHRAVSVTNGRFATALVELARTLEALGDHSGAIEARQEAEAVALPVERTMGRRVEAMLDDTQYP